MYIARVRLEDTHSNDVWKEEGRAENVLLQAFRYIIRKDDSAKARNKFVQFIADDWQAFDKAMNKIFFKR